LPHLKKNDSAVVFVGDDLQRVNKAYWGAYGIAKAGLLGLMNMLHDETEKGPVRISMLQPGPMRTSIRSRAFVEEAATQCPLPEKYAPACVHLLSAQGREYRGQVFAPRV
jgi:short-subunit dehydrogenase